MVEAVEAASTVESQKIEPQSQAYSYGFSDYLALPRDPITWLIEPLVPAGGSVMLYGDAKKGKSFLAIQLAMAISKGLPDFLGFPVVHGGTVLYAQFDTPRSLWMNRLEMIDSYHAGQLAGVNFMDRESLDTWPFDISKPEHFSKLREEVDRIQPVAVIVDTLKEASQADENDATESQTIVARLTAATKPAALILITHSRKSNGERGPDLINDIRGSNYLAGKMDSIMRLTTKKLNYTGRAVEDGSIPLGRTDSLLFYPNHQDRDLILNQIRDDPNLTTESDKARELSTRLHMSFEAARSLLRRSGSGRSATRRREGETAQNP